MHPKLVIGRVDKADFPEFGLEDISIKIDTGAYTSSIHCHHIKEIITNEGKKVIFQLLDPEHPDFNNKTFSSKHYKKKLIKSSNGNKEERFIIQSEIVLFKTAFPIELSLSERGEMKYPVLIGRKLLNSNFIVDTSKKNISFKQKNK
ncbi:MAG: hypothetical protein Kow0079_10190 [Vicingaceae bacterium]